ncbi:MULTISPECIES: restriction endonuclease subunit S [Klebsiella]|uniref:restriction endonuclease subunit S n=1 Tax=Klebsiella TaxID=570 RepID=UPI000B6356E6|nr:MULTISPECIES: restriction endonuclease subunit S [Klebsiella]EGT3582292.1 restriction endonuclease subunit S [Klebsiella oxytoca]HDE1979601.1 restriction endonuclease subunit S [Klebsiella quasipneumoniae]EMF0805203.1 restriction endonuclease subunit S [Klebsiella aerogenes]KAB1557841.1 restriction endonuclease subunit S [Klebsiella pneumoniae]MBD1361901.1 restriction endonuclease subunit S [Klebsiella pneumoniae]
MTEQQLPAGWQMVKFGDIAKHISKRVEPSETDLDIYVGLEHLDPDSLKIKRHGTPSDVEGQKLLVKKGQIIFGKRRAYQRKVAVADWDCICSAHAMVLEANSAKVIPEFLPFFMQSDVFMNRAVAISEGSLSPTIKWKILAQQEFLIPPTDKQETYVSILKKISSVVASSERALAQANLLHDVLGIKSYSTTKKLTTLDSLCIKIQDGTHFSPQNIGSSGDYQYVTSKNIRMGKMEFLEKEYISQEEHKKIYTRCDVRKGDILLTKDGANTGNVCLNELDSEISLLSSVAFLRVDPNKADCNYVYHWLMLRTTQRDISSQMAGNAITRLTLKKIKSMMIPDLCLNEQKRIGDLLSRSHALIQIFNNKIEHLKRLNRAILAAEEN